MPQNHSHTENASRLYVYVYTSFCPHIKGRLFYWICPYEYVLHPSTHMCHPRRQICLRICMYACVYVPGICVHTYERMNVYSCKYFPLWWSMQPIIHNTCYLTSVFSNTNNRTMFCDLRFYFIYKTLVFPTPQTICQTWFNLHN